MKTWDDISKSVLKDDIGKVVEGDQQVEGDVEGLEFATHDISKDMLDDFDKTQLLPKCLTK